MQLDPETLALQRSIQNSKIEKAKLANPGEKLMAGARLFDVVRQRMLCGIRDEFPEWTESEIDAEFRRRIDLQRRRDERGFYTVIGELEIE